MELIFEDKCCKATYIEEHKRVFFKFNGYLNIEQAISMYTAVLEFMKTHTVVSFLNDLQEIKGTFTNLTRWLFENMQETLNLGLKYDALVLNNDIFTEFAAKDFSKKLSILQMKSFKSMEEAEDWLKERENS